MFTAFGCWGEGEGVAGWLATMGGTQSVRVGPPAYDNDGFL